MMREVSHVWLSDCHNMVATTFTENTVSTKRQKVNFRSYKISRKQSSSRTSIGYLFIFLHCLMMQMIATGHMKPF